MGSVPAEELDDLTEGLWADPRAGALIERAEGPSDFAFHSGAVELLDRAIPLGGVDAAYVMAVRASSLYELGRAVEARSQLEMLRIYPLFSAIAFHRAAEAAEMSAATRSSRSVGSTWRYPGAPISWSTATGMKPGWALSSRCLPGAGGYERHWACAPTIWTRPVHQSGLLNRASETRRMRVIRRSRFVTDRAARAGQRLHYGATDAILAP